MFFLESRRSRQSIFLVKTQLYRSDIGNLKAVLFEFHQQHKKNIFLLDFMIKMFIFFRQKSFLL